ncbi:MAG: Wzz/FepE/Etk N-terminal domain-containing protein [Firmicutes bacterium]|nr:Wzz/FepE/Etk N-terminal domain-containing protein [Bacillota bacterium]
MDKEVINPDEIDLRNILKIIDKWKKVIALITLISVLASVVVSYFILKPVYESKAMLMVTRNTSEKDRVVNNSQSLESLISNMSQIPQLTMNTYVNQLKTEILLHVNQLKTEILFQRVAKRLFLDPKVYSPTALSGITTATALKDSNLIELKVLHNDPLMASRIANTISEQYLELISEKNQDQMVKSVSFYETQGEKVEKELDDVVQKLKEFDSQPGGVAYLEQQSTAMNQDLSKYQSMLNEARVNLKQNEAGAQRLSDELSNTPKTIPVKKVSEGSPTVYISEEANPVYITLSQGYADKQTNISELTAKIEVVESVIAQTRQEFDQIQKALVERKTDREKLDAQKARLVTARNMLADKVTETQIAKSIDLGETSIVVVSPAMVPSSPIKPNKQLNIAVAFVLGLMMAVFIVFILEHLDNTIKSPQDVADKLHVPLLGSIPRVTIKS